MRILVTGGAGFIRGDLVKQPGSRDAGEVLVLDHLQWGYSAIRCPPRPNFEVDIRDTNALAEAFRGCEIVFHLTAGGVKRLVFPSSREVCGDPRSLAVPETAPLRAKNAHGASKTTGKVYYRLAAQ